MIFSAIEPNLCHGMGVPWDKNTVLGKNCFAVFNALIADRNHWLFDVNMSQWMTEMEMNYQLFKKELHMMYVTI